MKDIEKEEYCLYVIQKNYKTFTPKEKLYYQGKTSKNPHNIANKFWQQAWNYLVNAKEIE